MASLMEDAEILAEPGGLTLLSPLPNEVMVFGDQQLLARAVMNLIDNAIKHNEAGGRVTVGASAEGGQAVLTTYSRSLLSRRSITQQRNAGARAWLKHCAGDHSWGRYPPRRVGFTMDPILPGPPPRACARPGWERGR